MRRTLTRTSAPILNSLRRIVPQVASANWVCRKATRRRAQTSTYAIAANHSRNWLARMVLAEVRSANRSSWHSLMRFSHVAACAINLLVEVTGLMLAASQRGDDKARVGLAAGPLGLADDAARPAPAIQRRPGKVLEAPCRLAGLLAVLARGGQFGSDRRREARILGQAEEEVDAIVLAPMHQLLAGKPGIGAQQDTHPRPAGAEVAGRRCAPPPRPPRRWRRCWNGAVWPPRGAGRRRCKAAGSSSNRNSRGRSGPPGARAAGRRWHRDRG